MEQKTVEQIARDMYPPDNEYTFYNAVMLMLQESFVKGYTTAQQSQPMWREIEASKEYMGTMVKGKRGCTFFHACGDWLISQGYTHYLSSEDLLRLPINTKTQ